MKKSDVRVPPAASGTVMVTELPWKACPTALNEQVNAKLAEIGVQENDSLATLPPDRSV